MHSGCKGPILLGAVVIYVAMAIMESDINVKKHKMREHLCTISYVTKSSVGIQFKNKGKKHGENAVNCIDGKEIVRTRGYVVRCRPVLQNLVNLASREDKTEDRMRRILMMPSSDRDSLPGRQLYLTNNSIVTCPFLYFKRTVAIAYIPSQRKLVMSIVSPNRIVLVPVDEEKTTVLKTTYKILGIVIDDEKYLMFMKIKHPECVGVMTTHGKTLTILFRIRSCIIHFRGGIVADHKRSLIYVLCVASKILQFTYHGVPKGHVTGTENAGYNFNMQGDFLYHVTKAGVLVQVSLSNHSITKLTTLKLPKSRTILVVDNILYVKLHPFRGDLFVVNVSDMSTLPTLKTGFGEKVANIAVCLIA